MDHWKLALLGLCCLPALLCQAQLSEKDKKIAEQFRVDFMQCSEYTGVPLPALENLTELLKKASELNRKCWRKCYLQSTGMVDIQGKLILKNVASHVANLAKKANDEFTVSKAEAIVETCQTMKVKDDPCLAAPAYFRCIAVNMDKVALYGFVRIVVVNEMRNLHGPELQKPMQTESAKKIVDTPPAPGGYKLPPPPVQPSPPDQYISYNEDPLMLKS